MAVTADVAIVGAGLAGATAALAPARRGLAVTVLEQMPGPVSRQGAEVLQPRSLEICDRLGLLDAVRAVTHPVHTTRIGELGGEWLTATDFRELGGAYPEVRSGNYGEIHRVMVEAAAATPGVRLLWGTEATRLRRDATGTIVGVDTTVGPVRAPLVLGADGRTSEVREALGIETEQYRYPAVLLGVTINTDGDVPSRVDMIFGHGDGASLFPLPGGRAWLSLLTGGDTYAWMCQQRDRGLSYFQYRLSAFFPEHALAISQIRSIAQVNVQTAYYLRAARWALAGVALLGDAAHGVSPVRGQGSNLAMADAWELAEQVGRLPTPVRAAAAIGDYERRRRPHVRYIQADGELTTALITSRSPLTMALRQRLFRNVMRAPRATTRIAATFAGIRRPPSALEQAATALALTIPPLDRLLPA